MKFLAAILLGVMISNSCFAGIMLEPYIGYESGTQSAKYKSTYSPSPSTDLGGVISGVNLGARLGYDFLGFWAALDYQTGSGQIKFDNSSIKSSDMNRSTTGLTAGFNFPILLRVWAGYILKEETKFKGTGTEDTLNGNGYKLGVGYQGLPFFSLNLEYYNRNYTDNAGSLKNAGFNFGDAYADYKHGTYMISLSLPLDL